MTLGQKLDLLSIIGGERPVGGRQTSGPAASAEAATSFESGAATAHAANARLPCIEGFFCKIQPDKDKLLRTIASVKKVHDSDKDKKLKELEMLLKLKELEMLVSDTVEVIDPHKETEILTMLFQKSDRRREFEVNLHPKTTF
jgi:hypothetical protein